MDKHRTNALQYGHLGTAIYDPDAQIWGFTRRIEKGSSLSLVGRSELTVPGSMSCNNQSQFPNGNSHKTTQATALVKACPELASSTKYLLGNEARSQVIARATDSYDPRVSKLFALGNASFEDGNRITNRTMPIAVLAWGESASSLKFTTLENTLVEEMSSNIHGANVPSITSRESGWWTGYGTSVRQICFSDSVEETSTWMAVRFPRSTRVFRPLCHRFPVPARYGDDESFHDISPNSRLDANPLVNISISMTGGHSHADVTINPMYQRQVAIVDEIGNWSVWEVQGRHQSKNKGNWRANKTSFGHLPLPDCEDKDNSLSQEHYDGWASITWVEETDKLLVCDRRNAVLFNISSDPVKLCRVDLDLERNSEWILDIKRSPANETHIFVLTSSKIIWLNVVSRDALHHGGDESIEIPMLLSWRHFRGLEDTSLQLSLLKSGDDISLTLYSRLNKLVQTFRFSCSAENMSKPISVSDPSLLPLPLELEPQDPTDRHGREQPYISSLHFEDVDDDIISRQHDAPVNMKLVKLFAQQTDMSVVEVLYLLPTADYQHDDMIFQEKRPRFPQKKLKKAKGVSKSDGDIDNFIVDDWDESTVNSDLGQYWKLRNAKLSMPVQQRCGLDDRWVFDFNAVYSTLIRQTDAVDETMGDEGPRYDFNACMQYIKRTLQESESLGMTVSPSLLDITDSSPSVNDIDTDAREFQNFLGYMRNEMGPMGQYRCFKVDTHYPFKQFENRFLSSDILPQPDVTLLYDSLVHDWLAALPSDVPARTRIAKEKLIRRVSAELSLARILILRKPQVELKSNSNEFPDPIASLSDDAKPSFHSEDEGTIRASKGHGRAPSQPTTSQDYKLPAQFSDMPEFPPPEPTSSFPSSLPSSQPPQQQRTTDSPASRLRLYTTIDEQPALSKDATSILSHWQPGSDPTSYDWQKTSQALETEEIEQYHLSRTSSSKRKKREARKRMALRQSRLERPPGLPSDPATVPSSSVPVVKTSRSQSQGGAGSSTLGFPQSSQMIGGLPSSQFEFGFGGPSQQPRSGSKGKPKKKRAAGF